MVVSSLVSSHFFRVLLFYRWRRRSYAPVSAIGPHVWPASQSFLDGTRIVLAIGEITVGARQLALGVTEIILGMLQIHLELVALLIKVVKGFHLFFRRFVRAARH